MKRFILGVALLAVLFGGALAVGQVMEIRHQPVIRELNRAAELALSGASEAARDAALAARDAWQESWKFTAAFSDHTPMGEVDDLFAALPAYLPEAEEFAAACLQLVQRTAAVIQDHALSWWNLL